MREASNKRRYLRPTIVSEKVFEQAALSCVVRDINSATTTLTTLKVSLTGSGCGYSSS